MFRKEKKKAATEPKVEQGELSSDADAEKVSDDEETDAGSTEGFLGDRKQRETEGHACFLKAPDLSSHLILCMRTMKSVLLVPPFCRGRN